MDKIGKLDDELYELKSDHHSNLRNNPGRPSEVRLKLESLRDKLKAVLDEYKGLGQGIVVKYWWTAYRSLWRKSNADVSADVDALSRMIEAAEWSLKHREGKKGGRPTTDDRDVLFASLIAVFGEFTGYDLTYPDKRGGFRGSGFVSGVAKLIDPNLTEDDLRRGLDSGARLQKWKIENTLR